MRLDINLASQPYEDARQFWMRWGTAVGAVELLTLVLLALDATGWVNARRDRQAIAEKRTMIVAGDSRDRALELARRMEESRRFSQTYVISERFSQTTSGDSEQFEIAAVYIPEPLAAAGEAPKTE